MFYNPPTFKDLEMMKLFFSIIPRKHVKMLRGLRRLTGRCSPLGSAPPTVWPKGRRDGWRTGGEERNKHREWNKKEERRKKGKVSVQKGKETGNIIINLINISGHTI